jgi:hypothetical protein
LRGYPWRPEKCKGKKVILTPMNIKKKKIIIITLFKTTPKNRPHHKVTPVKMPKTAPRLNT